jgi:sodium-dependent phosphate cotransporter
VSPPKIEDRQNLQDSQKSLLPRVILLLGLLYLFLLSVGLLGSSLKLFGKDLAETLMTTTSNPVLGLFIGILVTSIVQSSSMTTSLLVGMVGSGLISVENAIPIVMGANIGTTITNILVSLVHINRSGEFRRAFAASTVHDIFNILSVIVFLPIQVYTNFLGKMSDFLAEAFSNVGGLKLFNPLGAITKPVIHLLIDLFDKNAIILCIFAVLLLFASLHFMVRTLRSVFITRLTGLFQRYIFKTTLRAFLVGLVLTVLVQSSSITTSLIVPLAGSGVLTLIQIFPYTLGANLGTTATAILASLALGNIHAVTIAFCHMFFNICGIGVFMPLKKIPITLASRLADYSVKSKLVPLAFVVTVFFLIPLALLYLWR